MLDFEDDSVGGGFDVTPTTALYRSDVNDPQLANAGQTPAVFEFNHTYMHWSGQQQKGQINFRLAKCILLNDTIPNDFLAETPQKLFERLTFEQEEKILNLGLPQKRQRTE